MPNDKLAFRLLRPDDIECKVKQITANGYAILLLYKTARTDMELLDETVGCMNWCSDYREIKGNLYCGIAVRNDSGDFVWKWDCGIESRADSDGNQKKGEASDAFKRAGFKWGVGRELYTAPFICVKPGNFNNKGGKTKDHFSVLNIEYDESRNISSVTIQNDSLGIVAYDWKQKKQKPKKPALPPAPEFGGQPVAPVCACCGKAIQAMAKGGVVKYTVDDIVAASKRTYGKIMCWSCMTAEKKRRNEETK